MILSNTEIHAALDAGRLVIKPEPTPRFPSAGGPHCPFDTHSVDLTLGPDISIFDDDLPIAFDLSRPRNLTKLLAQNSIQLRLDRDRPFSLGRGRFILGRTAEHISLPLTRDQCLAARIEGKSSRARLGLLVHFTAPTVHPGFHGTLTLEMINLGPAPILLSPGVPIAQLIIEQVVGLPVENPSQFQNQTAPEGNVSRPPSG